MRSGTSVGALLQETEYLEKNEFSSINEDAI